MVREHLVELGNEHQKRAGHGIISAQLPSSCCCALHPCFVDYFLVLLRLRLLRARRDAEFALELPARLLLRGRVALQSKFPCSLSIMCCLSNDRDDDHNDCSLWRSTSWSWATRSKSTAGLPSCGSSTPHRKTAAVPFLPEAARHLWRDSFIFV